MGQWRGEGSKWLFGYEFMYIIRIWEQTKFRGLKADLGVYLGIDINVDID
jgi:hypothetical protein